MYRPQRLLVATDFSADADLAVQLALDWAERFSAELHVIHSLEVPLPIFEPYAVAIPERLIGEARKAAQEKLEAVFAKATERGLRGSKHLGEVPAGPDIADRAAEIDADLVVIGTRGHTGLKHLLLGSVAESTVKNAKCSVLTVKGAGLAEPPKHITVGTDFSDHGNHALGVAADLAEEFGAHLHLAHAVDLRIPFVAPYEVSVPSDVVEAARRSALSKLEGVADELSGRGIATTVAVLSEPPHWALCEVAEKAGSDLIVTGSRGLGGLKHVVLGSVAERTLRHAPCSVLTVKDGEE